MGFTSETVDDANGGSRNVFSCGEQFVPCFDAVDDDGKPVGGSQFCLTYEKFTLEEK